MSSESFCDGGDAMDYTARSFANMGLEVTTKNNNPSCLELFIKTVLQNSRPSDHLIQQSWTQNPSTTLKLIFNSRWFVDDEKKPFYTLALWLYHNHPKTLVSNIENLAKIGYFNELLNILSRIAKGSKYEETERDIVFRLRSVASKKGESKEVEMKKRLGVKRMMPKRRKVDIKLKMIEDGKKAKERYCIDAKYRFLYDEILGLFVKSLKSDMMCLNSGKTEKITLAAKILPSIYSPCESNTSLCMNIACKIYTCQGIENENEDYLKLRLVNEVLSPLIKAIELRDFPPKEPSFLPHKVTDFKWKSMVDDYIIKGKFRDCVAIITDVSKRVLVKLGLLISELSKPPWKGKLISFSTSPEFKVIQGKTLDEKIDFINNMYSGSLIYFKEAFDKILLESSDEDKMIKKVFVFSEMEFYEASLISWESDYEVIQKNFKDKGFVKVPELVFWNLKGSSSVTTKYNGLTLINGFSDNLLNLFLEEGGDLNPESVMEASISGELYHPLRVYD